MNAKITGQPPDDLEHRTRADGCSGAFYCWARLMGLDIHVDVTAADAIYEIENWDDGLQKSEGLRVLRGLQADAHIHTRTGSYHGLHVLRQEYARLKGWEIDKSFYVPITEETGMSHLVNHSDCEGYYLPDDFPEPQWIRTTGERESALSIGSSKRLMEELTELLDRKDKWPEDFAWRWDALFAAAIASVATSTVMVFS